MWTRRDLEDASLRLFVCRPKMAIAACCGGARRKTYRRAGAVQPGQEEFIPWTLPHRSKGRINRRKRRTRALRDVARTRGGPRPVTRRRRCDSSRDPTRVPRAGVARRRRPCHPSRLTRIVERLGSRSPFRQDRDGATAASPISRTYDCAAANDCVLVESAPSRSGRRGGSAGGGASTWFRSGVLR